MEYAKWHGNNSPGHLLSHNNRLQLFSTLPVCLICFNVSYTSTFSFPEKYYSNARCLTIPRSRWVIGCPGALTAFLNDNHMTSPSLYQITMEWLDLPEQQAPVYIPLAGWTEAVLFLKVRQTIAVGDLPSAVHPALLSKACPRTDKVILCCFLLPPFRPSPAFLSSIKLCPTPSHLPFPLCS